MRHYWGIKTPDRPEAKSYIWWIADSEHNAWEAFFSYPNKSRERMSYRWPLAEAIQAYEGIGYECVRIEIKEKP
jgi:hypothetical protein